MCVGVFPNVFLCTSACPLPAEARKEYWIL